MQCMYNLIHIEHVPLIVMQEAFIEMYTIAGISICALNARLKVAPKGASFEVGTRVQPTLAARPPPFVRVRIKLRVRSHVQYEVPKWQTSVFG